MSRSSNPEWHFFAGGPDAPRYGGDPTKHAVDRETETFVREVLQNSNDQRASDGEPVQVTFRLRSLSGERLEDFKRALDWAELEEHLQAVSTSEQGRGYAQFLDRIRAVEAGDADGLRLLVVEDSNTTGLTGEWSDDDSNFTALVRDELYSNKQDDTAGGSYGLGKSVLWTFSGASTVVFNSALPEESSNHGTRRLIARTKLPTHRLGGSGDEFQGAGWFCQTEPTGSGTRPGSIWDDRARDLARSLGIERAGGTGTSAMVVGFRDPTRDDRPDIDDVAGEIVSAARKYFWPAIHRGDLEVTVDAPSGGAEVRLDGGSSVEPFVEAYEDRATDSDSLDAPGDVASLPVGISVPDERDGADGFDGEVTLAAKLQDAGDDDTLENQVAMFRGAGMVVKYKDQGRVAFGDRSFYGVLACGEARSGGLENPTDEDVRVDRFLRAAEPPTHDDWQSTENLRERYKQGYKKGIDDMTAEMREKLRALISQGGTSGRSLPDKVLRRFQIHGRGSNNGGSRTQTVVDVNSTTSFDGSRWEFDGALKPDVDKHGGWTAWISLESLGEDRSTFEEIAVDNLDVCTPEGRGPDGHPGLNKSIDDGVARIDARHDVGKVEFEGISYPVDDADPTLGTVGETRIEVETDIQLGF